MQHKAIHIREAAMTDVPALTTLMNELGYSTTKEEMQTRFTNIVNHKDYKTLIATTDTQIVGMIGMVKNYFYEQNGLYVRVLALVTTCDCRRHGIGGRLLEACENWAGEVGAGTVLLNCGNREEREAAHRFYQNRGYQVKSSGFVKRLGNFS